MKKLNVYSVYPGCFAYIQTHTHPSGPLLQLLPVLFLSSPLTLQASDQGILICSP